MAPGPHWHFPSACQHDPVARDRRLPRAYWGLARLRLPVARLADGGFIAVGRHHGTSCLIAARVFVFGSLIFFGFDIDSRAAMHMYYPEARELATSLLLLAAQAASGAFIRLYYG